MFQFPSPRMAETAPPNSHIPDFRFIILEGRSYEDQSPCITQSSLPQASIWSYFKVCIYLERTSFTHIFVASHPGCRFRLPASRRTDPYLEQSISCHLIPKSCQRSKCVPQNQMTPSLLGACLSSGFFNCWDWGPRTDNSTVACHFYPYLRMWSHVLFIKLSISEVETRGDGICPSMQGDWRQGIPGP